MKAQLLSINRQKFAKRWSIRITLTMGAFLLVGCTRDPQIAKMKHLDKGEAYFQKGKYREAAIEYQNAIQIDPRFAKAHFELAQCFVRQSQWTQAYAELLRTVDLEPTNWKAQLDLGNLLLAAGKYPDALERAQIVLKADPQNAQAQVLFSEVAAAQGNLPQALSAAQQAIQMDPGRSTSYLNLALIQERNKDAVGAEQNFQKALSIDSTYMPAILGLGNFYEQQKRWRDAENQFRQAIAVRPQDPMLRALLARLFLNEGRKGMAEQVMQDAKNALKNNANGYRMLGDFYFSQGESDKALAEFASLSFEHPTDPAVAKTYAQILILRDRLDEAAKINDGVLKNSPKDVDALILRGRILLRQGKADDALQVLRGTVKDAPDNAMAHYNLGAAYADTWNIGQAEVEWRQAARLQPNMIEAQRALAKVASHKGDLLMLADCGEQLIKIEPHSPEGYVVHAEALLKRGDQAGAEGDLRKAIEGAPENSTGYIRMGDLRALQKRYDEAENFYSEALGSNPSVAEALTGLMNLDLVRNQPAKALRRVQSQIALAPNNSQFYLLLGQAELRNQDLDKAEAAFEKAVALDKNNVPAFLLLANVQVSRGSVEEAIAGYNRALQANPRDLRIYVALANLTQAQGNWQQAEALYQKALQIQPDYPVAANNLAYLMLEHDGNVNVALSLAQTGRRGLPDLANTADTLGWAYFSQGVYNAAIDLLQEAVKAEPKNPTYHYHLGMAYQRSNNHAMAKEQLEYTLQISPNFRQADGIRRVLAESPQKD